MMNLTRCRTLIALKGAAAAKYHTAIEHQCEIRCGRQALRVLDVSMTVGRERMAPTALQELNALKCGRMQELEGVLN